MWNSFVVLLCLAGLASVFSEIQTVDRKADRHTRRNVNESERRFACPVGFFRLRRNCYYLSAGVASWREAHFNCKDRNATLAVLNKPGKDKILRRYLMGDQFTKLERWIGGIYNWQQMDWEWGVTGEKLVFQNFTKTKPTNPSQYAWHCIIMDPALKYKWNARTCVERKHYICEAPAGRIDRHKRRNTGELSAPQNLRLKPRKKNVNSGKDHEKKKRKLKKEKRRQKRLEWRKRWEQNASQQIWSHGINLGSRPPQRVHHSDTANQQHKLFLGDGPHSAHKVQGLSQGNDVYAPFHNKINDFSMEEILLKT